MENKILNEDKKMLNKLLTFLLLLFLPVFSFAAMDNNSTNKKSEIIDYTLNTNKYLKNNLAKPKVTLKKNSFHLDILFNGNFGFSSIETGKKITVEKYNEDEKKWKKNPIMGIVWACNTAEI